MKVSEPPVTLHILGREVAEYVTHPALDDTLSPRPYLHPVRTLGGTVVTDVLPEDHRWHLGVSLAVQDVAGTNLWGGRTYVRDRGYTWLHDHGRIVHDQWVARTADSFGERLCWQDPSGKTLLDEQRTVHAHAVADSDKAWLLDFRYELTNPTDRTIELGSPATNGRPGGAGYGGFFWRATAAQTPTVFTATAEGEEDVNGSAEPWLAFSTTSPGGGPYTLVFTGLADEDRWFVRAAGYPGVCVALAFERPLPLAPGQTLARRHRVLVSDGALTRDEVAAVLRLLPAG